MANISKQSVRSLYGSFSTRKIIAFATLLCVVFILGWTQNTSFQPDSARLFLSALAGVQAGVLAIVFSVTILGVQLIADRYTPRLTSLLVEAPIFRFTFIVFLVSIALDLLLLYNVPESPSQLFTGLVYFSSGIAIIAGVSLYTFIMTALDRSTPDGILAAFRLRQTPEQYREQAAVYNEPGTDATHPLQPLYALIMSAISNREWPTANQGLEEFENISTMTLTELSRSGEVPLQNATQESKALFKEPTKQYLPDIAVHAHDNGESELMRKAIRIQGEIGKVGIKNHRQLFAAQAASGLNTLIREVPSTTEAGRIRSPVFDEFQLLIQESCEQPDFRNSRRILHRCNSAISHMFRQDLDRWAYEDPLLTYYGQILPEAESAILDYYGQFMQELKVDWEQRYAGDDLEFRPFLRLVYTWRSDLIDTTERILHFRAKNGCFPVTEGNFYSTWGEVCKTAINSPAEDFAVVLCKLQIEAAYEYQRLVGEKGSWANRIYRLKADTSGDIVEQAISELHNSGRTDLLNVFQFNPGTPNEANTVSIIEQARNVFSRNSSVDSFESWLYEFEKEVEG